MPIVGQFHIGVLPPFFGEYLDPLEGGMKIVQVVSNFLPFQNYSRRTRLLRNILQRLLLRSNRRPVRSKCQRGKRN